MVLACLPLPVICLPLLFICLPGWVLVVGFPAGLSPTSFHLSPTSFHLSGWVLWLGLRLACLPRAFICLPLLSFVSQFFSFVSQFFSFLVSQAGCLWSGSRLACLAFVSYFFSLVSFPFICRVVRFPAGLSPTSFPTSFHLSPSSFHCLWCLWSRVCGWLVSHFLSFVSHFLSFVSHFFSFVSNFLSFVSQAGCLWSGFRLACLPLPFICLPLLFICLPGCLWSGLRLACLPRAFICLPLLSFVSQFFSFVSHFFSFPKQFTVRGSQCFKEWSPWCWMVWSGSQPACLPLPLSPSSFQSGFPAGLSPTSFHLPPNSFHLSPRPLPFICLPLLFIVSQAGCGFRAGGLPLLFICLPGWVLVVGFPGGLSPTSFHLSPTSFQAGWSGRVPGWLVSHFLSFVSHFFSACGLPIAVLLGACGRVRFPAGLSPTSFHLFPTSFHLSPTSRLACLPLLVRFPAGLSPTSFHLSPTSFHLSPTSFHLSPRLGAFPASLSSLHLPPTFPPSSLLLGVLNSFLRCVRPLCHCWCPPIDTGHAAFLFICLPCLSLLVSGISIHLPGLLLVVSAVGRWPCGVSIHLSPRSATGVARPFPLATQRPHSFVSQVCHCWCPPFSAGDATFLFVCLPGLFICLPGLSLLVSALFRWPCSISVHLSHRLVTGGVRPFLLFLFICLPGLSHVSPRPVTGDVRPFPLAM